MSWSHPTILSSCNCSQCCQCYGLPTQLGYFEMTWRRSKICWVGGLKWATFHLSAYHGNSFVSIIHLTRKSTMLFFCLIGWIWLFYSWKAPKFGKVGVWLHDKIWTILKLLAMAKKVQFAAVWCSLSFGNTDYSADCSQIHLSKLAKLLLLFRRSVERVLFWIILVLVSIILQSFRNFTH